MFLRDLISVLCLIVVAASPIAASQKPLKPSRQDRCPVCGMFVWKDPDFLAQIIFKDGSYAMFDGAKDMFKYYLNMRIYNPTKTTADIDSIYVNDYYTLLPVDGRKAYFVIGSNITGPMGRELIPFATWFDARVFMKDHNGRAIVRFNQVTAAMLKEMD